MRQNKPDTFTDFEAVGGKAEGAGSRTLLGEKKGMRYPDNHQKQNHYERWLAERAIGEKGNCGCEWCLEWDAEATILKPTAVVEAVSKIVEPEPYLDNSSPEKSGIMRQGNCGGRRGRPAQPITPEQQAVLNRTDITIRAKAQLTGLTPAKVGRLTKRG